MKFVSWKIAAGLVVCAIGMYEPSAVRTAEAITEARLFSSPSDPAMPVSIGPAQSTTATADTLLLLGSSETTTQIGATDWWRQCNQALKEARDELAKLDSDVAKLYADIEANDGKDAKKALQEF